MLHYLIELAVWLLGSYFAGACIGCILKKWFGVDDVAVAAPAVAAAVVAPAMVARSVAPAPTFTPPAAPVVPKPVFVAPVAAPVVAKPVVVAPVVPKPVVAAPVAAPVVSAPVVSAPVAAVGKMERPRGLSTARSGKADNLQRISGVGPKNEKVLHTLGFFHFDQIAAWTSEQVNWVDDHLKFNGRIKREEWIRQARLLADGKDEEFAKQYGTGGLRSRQGSTLSGSRTRR